MNDLLDFNFSSLTGLGVRIAIVDSGYLPGKRDIHTPKGVNFSRLNSNKSAEKTNGDFLDKIGH